MIWNFTDALPGGHLLFVSPDFPGYVAIADEGGRTPGSTSDDGILVIDNQRPIAIEDDGTASVPVLMLDNDMAQRRTPVSFGAALYLADQHRLTIVCDMTGSYRVVHLNDS